MVDPAQMSAQASALTFDPAKLESLEELLQGLKERARAANAEGDLIMLAVYNDLLTVTSQVVVKAHARREREQRAQSNKAEKALRKQRKAAREAERAQRSAQGGAQNTIVSP